MPSARVWNEMKFEPVGFWPVPMNQGDEYVMLLKAPTHVIKAIYQSCPVSLSVSVSQTSLGDVVSTSLRIADDQASPLMVTGVHRHPEEQLALEQILLAGQTPVILFDELSRPVLRAKGNLDPEARIIASSLLGNGRTRYTGPWNSTLAEVLDELEGAVDPARAVPLTHALNITNVPLALSDFQTIRIAAVGEQEVREFRLEDTDEGYVLEHAAWHLMEGLFGKSIFHSPQTMDGQQLRELTDIVAFCAAGVCFMEAKAVAVLATDPHRSTERRAKNIQKQIDKGLVQLSGAMRSVATGRPLTSRAGKPIEFPEDTGSMRHGIVVVSELLPNLDWTGVATQLLSGSQAAGALLHLLDLQELRFLVGVSKDDPVRFMAHLVGRFQVLAEAKSAYIRTRLKGPPLP